MSVEITCAIEGAEEFGAAMERLDVSVQRHVHRQLAGWAADVKALASQLVPVRTGYLRSSIYAKVREWFVEVGAEATYALFVEFGTRYTRARPYLYPAVQDFLPRLEGIILEALDAAKTEAGLT